MSSVGLVSYFKEFDGEESKRNKAVFLEELCLVRVLLSLRCLIMYVNYGG